LLPALDGSCYFGFTTPSPAAGSAIVHVNASGTLDWLWNLGTSVSVAIKLGGLTSSNCCFFDFQGVAPLARGGRIANDGSRLFFQPPMLSWTYSGESTNAKPIIDNFGQALRAGIDVTSPYPKTLCKCDTTGLTLWCQDIGTVEQWTLGRDPQANNYLAAASGLFSKRTTDGVLVWSTNYGQECTRMLVDLSGNRFLGFANGSIARLANELPPRATVHLNRSLDGLSASGFRFSILSETQTVWQVMVSSNLNTWTALGTLTNTTGEVQFTDPAAIHQPSLLYKVLPWP
jgi:hypothetical protein